MQSTLNDHLTGTRVGVSVAEYEASKALDSRQGASWAIWGATTGDLSIFEDSATAAPLLRKDVVLIGANFGLSGDAGEFKPFQNFHARASGGDRHSPGNLDRVPPPRSALRGLRGAGIEWATGKAVASHPPRQPGRSRVRL